MKLYLIRHAQRDFGVNFDTLKPEGIKQAKQLGKYFKNKKFDLIYCSPQNRAQQTLDEIKNKLKSKPKIIINKDIRQQSTPKEVGKDVVKRLGLKDETDIQTRKRAKKFLDKLLKKHSKETILIVTHKMFIKHLLFSIFKEEYKINSASITTLDFDEKGKLLKSKIGKTLYKVKPKIQGGWQYKVKILPKSVIKIPKTKKEIKIEIEKFLKWKGKKEDPNIRVEKIVKDRKESIRIIKNSKLSKKYFANPRFLQRGKIKQDRVKILEESIRYLYRKGEIKTLKRLLEGLLKFVNFLWKNQIHKKTGKFYSCLGLTKNNRIVLADFGEITDKREKAEKQIKKEYWKKTTAWLEKNCDKKIANFFDKKAKEDLSIKKLNESWGKEMKNNYEFWRDWKNLTNQEKQAIKSLKKAKKIILENIPKKEIIAIYCKGSFPRREMNSKSDVDTVTIVKHSKILLRLKKLEEKYRHEFNPKTQLSAYSIWELKNGKRSQQRGLKKMRAGTSRIIKHFSHYKLIYGKSLDVSNFPRRSHEKDVRSMVDVFRSIFIPMYLKKELGFEEIIKQVLWLVENEMRFLEKPTPHSWKELDKSIKDKNHIVHLTYNYRLKKPKDKKLRRQYIKRLKNYLDKLEKRLK